MFVSQELIVRVVNVIIALFYLGLDLRSLTTGEVSVVRIVRRANSAHRLGERILFEKCWASDEFLGACHGLVSCFGCTDREVRIGKLGVLAWVVRRITPSGEIIVLDRILPLPLPLVLTCSLLGLGSLEQLAINKALIKWLREFFLPAPEMLGVGALSSLWS